MPDLQQSAPTTPDVPGVSVVPPRPQVDEDDVDLFALWGVLKRGKWLIFLTAFLFSAAAAAMAFTMVPIYRAEVLLEYVTQDANQNRSSMMNQASSLAAVVGIKIPSSGSGSKETALAKLKSRAFLEKFITEENLMPVFFAKQWDEQARQWRGGNPDSIPTPWHGVEFAKGLFRVSEDIKTGLITLAVEWPDREIAARWANLMVERINNHLRMQAARDTQESVKYLTAELAKTTVVEIRQILIVMMEESIKNNMFANVRTEFAFRVIDPAVVSPKGKVVRPVKRMMVMTGFVLGILVGVSVTLFRNALQRQKRKKQYLSPGTA
ncbi:MAG: hypothetical protein HQL64_08520 [Magnetococcales bacterium]|nr:hypothetical protein [Magnetococcales bacterium]